MSLYRIDKSLEPLPWEKLSDGRYWGHIVVGKVKHKLPYTSPRGDKWEEWVGEEGLFNEDYINSLAGNPIVLTHPPSGKFYLNRDGLKVGHLTTRFGKEDDQLIMEAFIDDERGVKRIDEILQVGKLPEISPGYSVRKLIPHTDGSFEQIRAYNDHIAAPLLPGGGRGGEQIRMRFDSADIAVAEPLYFLFSKTDEKPKMKLKINGRTFEVDDEALVGEVENLTQKTDQLETDNQKLTADYERLEGEKDGLSTKLDSIEKSKPSEDAIATEIQSRLDTWALVLPEFRKDNAEFKPDFKLTSAEIKKAYLKHKLGDGVKLDEKSPEYWEGRWDSLKPEPKAEEDESVSRADTLLDQFNEDMSKPSKDKEKDKDLMEEVRNRYRKAHKKRSGVAK